MRFHAGLLCLLALVGSACVSTPPDDTTPSLALVGVSVVPMDGERVLADQTVVLRGDRIEALGPRASTGIPSRATRIDAGKLFLIPGLADMHAHLPRKEDEPRIELDDYLFLNVSRGVTTIRSMRGDDEDPALRTRLAKEGSITPRIIFGSPALTGDPDFTPAKARAAVAEYQSAGFDFVKLLGNVNADAYAALMAAGRERKFKICGHAPPTGLAGAIHEGQASIEHVDPYVKSYRQDASAFATLVDEQAAAGLCNCPDVYWYDVMWHLRPVSQLQRTEGLAYVPSRVAAAWSAQLTQDLATKRAKDSVKLEADLARHREDLAIELRILKMLDEKGAPLLVSGGDGPYVVPGFSMLEEMRIFRNAGLSPYRILRAATANAERFFGRSDHGSVKVGNAADLVLLGGNPLEDIENVGRIEGVFVRGRYVAKEEIATRLAALARKAGNAPVN